MGLLDRLHRAATGLGGALQAPLGLAKDLATAPFTDDETDGIFNTVYRATTNRGAQFFENTVGPKEGLGALIGGMPESGPLGVVRGGTRSIAGGVTGGLEFAYREGVSEPLTTGYTLLDRANLTPHDIQRGRRVSLSTLANRRAWSESYAVAQNRSPGQAAAYLMDLRPGSDNFEILSGTVDAIVRLTLDPTVIAGKAAMASRARYIATNAVTGERVIASRRITSVRDIEIASESTRVNRFVQALEGKNAAEIRQQFFPDHAHGPVVATVLAEAGNAEGRLHVIRSMLGDETAMGALRDRSEALAAKVDRVIGEQDELRRFGDDSLFADPEHLDRLKAEVDELVPEALRAERAAAAFRTLDEVPRVSRTGALRTQLTRNETYMTHPLAAPFRRAFNMEPQRLINLHDRRGDVQVVRMLRQSGMDIEAQDAIRARYMAAMNPVERQQVLVAAETAAVKTMADKAGMSVDEIETVLAAAGRGRGRASEVLRSRVYDGNGRSTLRYQDDDGALVELNLPLLVTQEANVLPMVDMREIRRATTPIGRFKLRHPSTEAPVEFLNRFMKLWRPSVLLRVGWPIRVGLDEQMRIMAKIGVFAQGKGLARAATGRRDRPINIRGYEVEGAYGLPGDADNIMMELNSAKGAWDVQTGQAEQGAIRALREGTGEWRSLTPEDPGYGESWERAVNLQLGKDAMARRFLKGQSTEEVVRWLRTTVEGRAHARRNHVRAVNPERWAEDVRHMVRDYTVDNPELKALALEGRAKATDLARIVPDAANRPMSHGEILGQATGTSGVIGPAFNALVRGAFRTLGEIPTNTLARNPFFDHLYRAETERLVNLADDQARLAGRRLDDTDLRDIEAKSREYALTESKSLLYDLAERSELSEFLKFVSPFFSAWQEVVTRWAGLAIENPVFIARMRLALQAPEKAGMVVDENGNEVDERGLATDHLGNPVKTGADRYIQLRIPTWAKDVPGLDAVGGVKFNKKSLNLVLQGTPGFGPVVQIPVNEIVKMRPDLEETLDWALPFGATQEFRDMLLPATVKRIVVGAAGDENRLFANQLSRIYFDMVVDYELGKREDMPTWDEANRKTSDLFKLRTFASFISPFAPSFISPYQMQIDAYRAAQTRLRDEGRMALADENGNERTADEWFYDTYGEEYFALTQSLSKSMDGIPPTIEGWTKRKEYQDLIEASPELGGLIIGEEGAGEFVGGVYNHQLATPLRPGDSTRQRETPDFLEASAGPDVRQGWLEYRRAMDLIDAERIDRGLPNLRVRAAQDLANIKQQITAALTEKFPEWAEERATFDRLAWTRRIEGMRTIVADPRMQGRPDMQGLAAYLQARDAVIGELQARGAAGGSVTLDSASNTDLAALWDSLKGALLERHLAWSPMYWRYLEHDPMEVTR